MSALDMTLDDMIKKKGGSRNAGGGSGKAGGGGGGKAGVVKSISKRGAGGRQRGGKKAKQTQRGGGQNQYNKMKPRMKVYQTAKKPTERLKTTGKVPQSAVVVADVTATRRRSVAAMAPAAKAAEAAARATALKAIGAAVASTTGRQVPAARALQRETPPKASEKPAVAATSQARGSAKPKAKEAVFTEDKLQMSLDDVIKTEVQKKKPAKAAAEQPKQSAAADNSKQQSLGRKGRMRLRGGQKQKQAQEKAQAKAKAKAKAKARSRAGQGGGGDSWGGRQKESSWGSKGGGKGWEDRKVQTGGMYSNWDSGTKRRADGAANPIEKWGRTASGSVRRNVGWAGERGGSNASSWAANGGGREKAKGWGRGMSVGGDSWGEMGRWRDDRWRDDERVTRVPTGRGPTYGASRAWADDEETERGPPLKTRTRTSERFRDSSAPPKTASVRTERASTRSAPVVQQGAGTVIRVSNVPKNLDERDIKDAFEDTGRVLKCIVERGVAFITFSNPAHAKKAVQTFDRGELNGQTIFVTMEHS